MKFQFHLEHCYTHVQERKLSFSSIDKNESILEDSCCRSSWIHLSLDMMTLKAPLSLDSALCTNSRAMSWWGDWAFLSSKAHLYWCISITEVTIPSRSVKMPIATPTLRCHDGELCTMTTNKSESVVISKISSITLSNVIASVTFIWTICVAMTICCCSTLNNCKKWNDNSLGYFALPVLAHLWCSS